MAKLLVVNIPYVGHINPTLGLVKGLVEDGHCVDYICAEEWRNKIETTGARLIPYINYSNIPTSDERTLRCYMSAYTTALMVGEKYDLIIYEMFFYLGYTLAKQLKKPVIRLFSSHALNDNVIEDMFLISSRLNHLPVISNIRRKSARLSWHTDILSLWITRKEKDRFFEIARCIPELNIVYTTKEFQDRGEEFDNRFKFVGSSITKRKEDSSSTWEFPFLEENKPLIYISMGTVYKRGAIFYKKCIRAFKNENYNVIISAGKRLNLNQIGKTPPNIKVFSSVPQLEILQKASLFITHGGMNSISEAIYYKVPMIVIPNRSDQPLNAVRVEQVGIGKKQKVQLQRENLENLLEIY